MPKSSKSKSPAGYAYNAPSAPKSFKDRNLAKMAPAKAAETLAPSEAVPMKLHMRMAGGG